MPDLLSIAVTAVASMFPEDLDHFSAGPHALEVDWHRYPDGAVAVASRVLTGFTFLHPEVAA